MSIRFRCVYCDKLLGIATRKAGTVVNCPQCGQPLIVPTPEPEPEQQPASVGARSTPATAPATALAGSVFEADDFDVLLEADPVVQVAPEPSSLPRQKTAVMPPPPATAPMPPRQYAPDPRQPASGGSQQYAPLPLPLPAQPTGMVLTRGKIILLVAAVGVLMLVAFGVGLLVGRKL
ncbi:MAG: hypothetical protein EXS09_00010 [Gemmataceae bacterium]|nr:hypothetical protein [Gemmataceae bacterium]